MSSFSFTNWAYLVLASGIDPIGDGRTRRWRYPRQAPAGKPTWRLLAFGGKSLGAVGLVGSVQDPVGDPGEALLVGGDRTPHPPGLLGSDDVSRQRVSMDQAILGRSDEQRNEGGRGKQSVKKRSFRRSPF